MGIAIGTKVKYEGKFDYKNGRYTYITGTVINVRRTIATHSYPAENEYQIEHSDGSRTWRTGAFLTVIND